MADTLMVMKDGRVIESGPTEAIFAEPREAYTRRLLAASIKEPWETPLLTGEGQG
jgi:oligopeptide transport system ATP-binding protein